MVGRNLQSEVTDINRQRFLSELAKLLTFMHEEDRQRAMAAYTALFDQADDEQAMLQTLRTPLDQAVQVARAYNSGRHSDGETDTEDGIPPFLQTIYDIGTAALSEQPILNQTSEDQFSLFDEEKEEKPIYDTAPDTPENGGESGEDTDAPAEGETAVSDAPETAGDSPAAQEAAEPEGEAAAAETGSESPADAPEAGGESEEGEAAAAADEPGQSEPEQNLEQKVSEFLENFTLKSEESSELPPKTSEKTEKRPHRIAVDKMLRKPRVPLLILYCLIAIPLTLALIIVLLAPTVVSLAAGLLCGVTGVLGFLSIFSSFTLMCDMLVVAGLSLILLALGLLLLWLFIWLIGGAIAGLVRAAVDLGGKWCYKEVPAE